MLTGKELGAAISEAIKRKRCTKAELARHFAIKPPSISDWVKRGTIGKEKLPELFQFFSDVVGPEHWGLSGLLVARKPNPAPYVTARRPSENEKLMADLIAIAKRPNDRGLAQLIERAEVLLQSNQRTKEKRA